MMAVIHAEAKAGVMPAGAEIQAVIYPAYSVPSLPPSGVRASIPEGRDAVSFPAFATEPERQADDRIERRIDKEVRKSFETGRQRGFQEGLESERETQKAARDREEKQRGEQLATLAKRFAEAQESYLHAVEQEVVKLALEIAARILRREAQMDPLLLTGAVRVALGQLAESTEVRLRVPPPEFDLWQEVLAHLPNLAVKPSLVAGDGMRTGDCMIETALGSVDLGVRSQLGEIERGFFDRNRWTTAEASGRQSSQAAEAEK